MKGAFIESAPRCVQRRLTYGFGLLAAAWLLCGAPAAHAADCVGASQVVARVKAALAIPDTAGPPADDGRRIELANDLAALRAGWTHLTAEAAAARWLSLADRFHDLQSAALNDPSHTEVINYWGEYGFAVGSTGAVTMVTLLDALPGPPVWKELRSQIEGRAAATPADQKRKLALTLLANLLLKDRAGFDAAIKDAEARFRKSGDNSGDYFMYELGNLRRSAIQRNLCAPADAVKAFQQVIDQPFDSAAESYAVQVPDLVGLAGEQEARALLRKAIRIPVLQLQVPGGGPTLSLLKEVVAAEISSLSRPQWSIITSRADVSLFEAMDRKFPSRSESEQGENVTFMVTGGRYGSGGQDGERSRALGVYILGLIEVGRIDDAVAATLKSGGKDIFDYYLPLEIRYLADRNAADQIVQYCEGVLAHQSVPELWPVYTSVANRIGRGEAALTLLRKWMADAETDPESLALHQSLLFQALLAMDRVDGAVEVFREANKMRTPLARGRAYEWERMPVRLIQLGRLLGRKDWVEEGITALLQSRSDRVLQDFESWGEEILLAFKEAGRLADMEAWAIEELAKGIREDGGDSPARASIVLGILAAIYDAAGRPADVMALLEHAPWWGMEDVGELRQGALRMPILRALTVTGNAPEAARLARISLLEEPHDDSVFAALVDVEGSRCLPFLEDLSRRDRFEERPLIWKAEVLRRAGQLDAAEAAARAALQIDPTDGEQYSGDRVRAYSVLGAILDAGGKKSDAVFFSNVVASVRMAEEGDRFAELGLIERSIPLYQRAEALFGEAYCVQWRLAERLQAMGRADEAEKHYAIAFERMPEQFGRVASFCFGCEGAFRSGASRGAAERVLAGLLDKEPVRPQVFYLMGLLREAQDRKSEAADYFKKALEKDPEYFDAMRSLCSLARVVFMTQDDRDTLMLKMLHMDPLQRHGLTYSDEISDFAGLWEWVGQAQQFNLKPETDVFPLTASKAHLAAQREEMGQDGGMRNNAIRELRWTGMGPSVSRVVPTFGETLMRNNSSREIVQWLQPTRN